MSPPVRDALGREHVRAATGTRIVSLVPSITELLFALDLGRQVVGRTTFCIHPRPAVDAVACVGGTKTPKLERISALGASHVVVNVDENRREDGEALQRAGLEVVATHPLAPRDNVELYRLLGCLFAREAGAERLCDDFLQALEALRRAAAARPRRKVLYLIWRKPWMSISEDTYIARMLAEAGLDVVNVGAPGRYPEVRADNVAWDTLDAVLLSSEPFPFRQRHVGELHALAGQADLPVAWVDGEMTSWYGSRAIAGCRYLRDLTLPQRTR